jgi:hypothetical protein
MYLDEQSSGLQFVSQSFSCARVQFALSGCGRVPNITKMLESLGAQLTQVNAESSVFIKIISMDKSLLLRAVYGVILLFSVSMIEGRVAAQSLHEAHERANVPCAACHMPEPSDIAPQEKSCVVCHGTMLEPREGEQQVWPDPHRSPHLGEGEVPTCRDCHKIHGKSEVTCVMCHRSFQFEVK